MLNISSALIKRRDFIQFFRKERKRWGYFQNIMSNIFGG
jgi:hypothetical protein